MLSRGAWRWTIAACMGFGSLAGAALVNCGSTSFNVGGDAGTDGSSAHDGPTVTHDGTGAPDVTNPDATDDGTTKEKDGGGKAKVCLNSGVCASGGEPLCCAYLSGVDILATCTAGPTCSMDSGIGAEPCEAIGKGGSIVPSDTCRSGACSAYSCVGNVVYACSNPAPDLCTVGTGSGSGSSSSSSSSAKCLTCATLPPGMVTLQCASYSDGCGGFIGCVGATGSTVRTCCDTTKGIECADGETCCPGLAGAAGTCNSGGSCPAIRTGEGHP